MWEIIPNSIKELHALFTANGKQLFIVGGCVRDFLLNKAPKDWDLATDATPEETLSITKKYKSHLHGKSFGVVVVYTTDNPEGFEIATFREDVYGALLGETRNPEVRFVSTIDEDVNRRDLRFNALFYDLDKHEVVDLVGGIDDINNKITSFVGDPVLRITEDPLRIQRFVRFGTRLGFDFDEASNQAILDNVGKLSIITRERVWEEMEKAYEQVEDFNNYIRHLIGFGITSVVFDTVNINTHYVEDTKFSSLEMCLAHLFSGNSTTGLQHTLVQRFKIPKDVARKVIFFLDILHVTAATAVHLYGKKNVSVTSDEELEEWFNFIEEFTEEELPVEVRVFTAFKPTIKALELKAQGFSDAALGKEIARLEIIEYNKL